MKKIIVRVLFCLTLFSPITTLKASDNLINNLHTKLHSLILKNNSKNNKKHTSIKSEVKDLNISLTYEQFLRGIISSGYISIDNNSNYFISDFMGTEPILFHPDKFFKTFSYKSPENYDVINKITLDWLIVYIDIYHANLDLTDDEYANKLLALFQSAEFSIEFDKNHDLFLYFMELDEAYKDHSLNGVFHKELMLGSELIPSYVPLHYGNSIKTFASNFLSVESLEDFIELEHAGLSYYLTYKGVVKKAYKTNYANQKNNVEDYYNHYVLLVESNGINTYVSVPNFSAPLKIGEEITVYGLLNPFVSPANNRLSVLSIGWFK